MKKTEEIVTLTYIFSIIRTIISLSHNIFFLQFQSFEHNNVCIVNDEFCIIKIIEMKIH